MTLRVVDVDLGTRVRACFTGRADHAEAPRVGEAGNLSHHRPHEPARLAADRSEAFAHVGLTTSQVHFMRQVHGTTIAEVTADDEPGSELREVDGAVTALPGRGLAVVTADCVPILLADDERVAAVHAGRLGLLGGIVTRAASCLRGRVRAAIGPAIGPCCYEVPAALAEAAERELAGVAATTTWGTPALDLPGAAARLLATQGVEVQLVGGCTRCEPGWFSHRRDPATGRQAGVIVREAAA